tara:strand:+ start:1259 stop:1927 length:669 start_codon:yes stop_codon:yes gene_type:complete
VKTDDEKRENMELWDGWSSTLPSATKPVSFGARKFTAIDPYYQIRRMTETFGPLGTGWHYTAHLEEAMLPAGLLCYRIELHYKGSTRPAVHVGSARLTNRSGAVDHDAPKKAITDGLTKCFSMLGMSADVFEGKFDDSKYVEDMRKEEEKRREWESERTSFCSELGNLGYSYEQVAQWCEAKDNPRPSDMNAKQRESLVNHLATPRGRAQMEEMFNNNSTGE